VTLRHDAGDALNAPSLAVTLLLAAAGSPAPAPRTEPRRPADFVSITDVDPTIRLDLRYHGSHNFLGRPVPGYHAARCLLTRPAATALKAVQGELRRLGLSLQVFDCYRPQRAVDAFVAWARDPLDERMKGEFYPRVPKRRLFAEGYIASRSGHSRGSAVDVTLAPGPAADREPYAEGAPLRDCTLPAGRRFRDGGLDLGTGYDCFDPRSGSGASLPPAARANREKLRALMVKHGFRPYPAEWWHFTLASEPYPRTYFDFEVE